jgi:hypothetical protein
LKIILWKLLFQMANTDFDWREAEVYTSAFKFGF